MKIKTLAAATALMAGSSVAMAVPSFDDIVTGGANIPSNPAESFVLTDTDGVQDNFLSYIELKRASYTHNLGIYAYSTDGLGNIVVGDKLEIFGSASEGDFVSVNFDLLNNQAWIDANDKKDIGQQFGFYLDVQNTGMTYYSHASLNGGVDHLGVYQTYGTGPQGGAWDLALAWEDLQGGGDLDYDDLVAYVNDVAPVPEPGTLALLGLGLVGLGAARRRKA